MYDWMTVWMIEWVEGGWRYEMKVIIMPADMVLIGCMYGRKVSNYVFVIQVSNYVFVITLS